MDHAGIFRFELDFADTLRCIPMAVRFKLDLVGIKVSLRQWSRFSRDERDRLLRAPCDSPDEIERYRQALTRSIAAQEGEPVRTIPVDQAPAWRDPSRVASQVVRFMESREIPPMPASDWAGLSPLQRFVLFKLSQDGHENVNFVPALREFGLAPA